MALIRSSLPSLPDPRSGNGRPHNLPDVLTIALTASICGAESCIDFGDLACYREVLFREFLELPGGLHGHDVFSRLFRLLDPTAFATCFGGFLDDLGQGEPGVVAIEGKTMRRSSDRAAGKTALHVATAFAADARMTIRQVAAGEKKSEITAAPSLLDLIDLTGALGTGDAFHCYGEAARLIRDRGGDWLFKLKANRPRQHAGVGGWFADSPSQPDGGHTTVGADNGGIEVRRNAVSHDVSWMLSDRRHPNEVPMPGLAALGMVEATLTRDGKTSTGRRLYLPPASVDVMACADVVRAHRPIENCVHWVLDAGFDEDRGRNRKDHALENVAIWRKPGLNALRTGRRGISILHPKETKALWTVGRLRSVIGRSNAIALPNVA